MNKKLKSRWNKKKKDNYEKADKDSCNIVITIITMNDNTVIIMNYNI